MYSRGELSYSGTGVLSYSAAARTWKHTATLTATAGWRESLHASYPPGTFHHHAWRGPASLNINHFFNHSVYSLYKAGSNQSSWQHSCLSQELGSHWHFKNVTQLWMVWVSFEWGYVIKAEFSPHVIVCPLVIAPTVCSFFPPDKQCFHLLAMSSGLNVRNLFPFQFCKILL